MLRRAKSWLSAALFRAAMHFRPSRSVGGLTICDVSDEVGAEERLDRLEAVIRWVDVHTPDVVGRWAGVLDLVLILPGGGVLGSHRAGLRGCTLSDELVVAGSYPLIAMVIEHEACHALLDPDSNLQRSGHADAIERACVQAEVALGQVLPGAEAEVHMAEAFLAASGWRNAPRSEHWAHALRVLSGHGSRMSDTPDQP